MSHHLAVDIGGTFTDVVLHGADGEVLVAKAPTTPEDPTEGLLAAIRKTGISLEDVVYFAHGTTIALNTLLQRDGASVGVITTHGFRDVLEIMRTNRPQMYDLQQDKPDPLVPRQLRYEISARLDYRGEEVAPVRREEVVEIGRAMQEEGVEAVAVALLHSYANPEHEREVGRILSEEFPEVSVTLSSDLTREWREFERTSTATTNAYTRPAMEDYLATVDDRLRAQGFTREVLIMQSNGGIMPAREARSQPVRTIMSGPAGGVIAGEHLSRQTGLADLITFDMGGTSADICLIVDGRASVRAVQEIERLPVLQPALDITSIGAGGGSIAWLDRAGALRVGPRSAGAVPGPVCYGQGGTEPTVTDANLVLGYIDPEYFLGGEIELDAKAARRAIEEKIAGPLGLSVEAAADGILRIVNVNMLRALRKVSVERGHDPRDFALVAFGGAGGLHAAQLGRDLELGRVLIPRNPGMTSATGMLRAEIRHDFVRTHVRPVQEADPRGIERHYREMEEAGGARLLGDGVTEEDITYVRTADVRYAGQEYTINVPVPAGRLTETLLEDFSETFHSLHEKLYTYRMAEERTVFVNLRVTASASNPAPADYRPPALAESGGGPKGRRTVYFRESGKVDCAIYERDDLAPGQEIEGPAVIEEPESTILVPPETRATIDEFGNIVMELTTAKKPGGPVASGIDSITVEVIRHRLISNATEMTETMTRAAYSPIIYEVLDFSNAIHDREGNVVAQALGIPLFLGAMSAVVKRMVEHLGIENIRPGDVLISNDPHHAGGTHVNDINMVVPIFWEDEIVLFANCKAHWIDIGGKDPGSWSPDAANMYQEGIIVPPIKLYEEGRLNETALDIIMANVRVPDYSRGDLRAQMAACRIGQERTLDMLERYGWHVVQAAVDEILDHGERLIRAEIEKIPDGTYSVEDYVDSDGVSDEPVKVVTTVTVEGSDLTVDFEGSAAQRQGAGGNCAWAGTVSSVRLAIKCLTDPDLPGNQGCYRPITVRAPKGTCVNPVPPAPVTVGLGDVTQVVIESIFRALAQALPERSVAGMYGTASVLVISGQDPRGDDELYVHLMPYSGGWGARASKDGISALMTIGNGDCLNIPAEVIETKYPLRMERYALIDDSGGPGRYRGGLGLAADYRLVESDAIISVGLSRYKVKPYGLFGGEEGRPSVTRVSYPDGSTENLYKVGGKAVPKGSLISHRCGGGGGYGPPDERDPELVRRDLREGYVTEEAARRDYGFDAR